MFQTIMKNNSALEIKIFIINQFVDGQYTRKLPFLVMQSPSSLVNTIKFWTRDRFTSQNSPPCTSNQTSMDEQPLLLTDQGTWDINVCKLIRGSPLLTNSSPYEFRTNY